jgi:hypothetical protein
VSAELSPELQERLARLGGPSSNGGGGAEARVPDADDLDWFLFHSFPECEVAPDTFAGIVPVYERALRAGAAFDHELLFVRALELSDRIGPEHLERLARAAVERVRHRGFDPADAIAALRFALRTLPPEDSFLDDLLESADLASFRFHWTVDFVLDSRDLDEYLALSYLRDDDPATADLLRRFPVPEGRLRRLAAFLAPEACRRRIEAGWEAETAPRERAALAAALAGRLGGFTPAGGDAGRRGGSRSSREG